MIFVLGGWNDKLDFLSDILKFDLVNGVLTQDSSFRLYKSLLDFFGWLDKNTT